MKISVARRIQFCAGHRVVGHEGKCKNIHGHNYVAYIYAEADQLDNIGRVIDFSIIKEKVGSWIESNWDHGFIFFIKDPDRSVHSICNNKDHKTFMMYSNPTAENMAVHLLSVCKQLFYKTEVRVTKIKLYETENCFAEVSTDNL